MNAAAWVFLFAAVANGLLLFCALVGAHEQQERSHRRHLKQRADIEDLTRYAEALELVLEQKTAPEMRDIAADFKAKPKLAAVHDLIAYNEAKRNLTDDRLHSWLDGWETPDGDGA